MGKLTFYIIAGAITLIIKIFRYIADERREQQGLPSKHREYMDSLTGGMDFIDFYRSDIEDEKVAQEAEEQARREKYVFRDGGEAMEDITSVGLIEKKSSEGSDKMDSI